MRLRGPQDGSPTSHPAIRSIDRGGPGPQRSSIEDLMIRNRLGGHVRPYGPGERPDPEDKAGKSDEERLGKSRR